MSSIKYHKLSILIADDFSSFRNTVNGMLLNLGVTNIAMASHGDEVIEKCTHTKFDVILCDYDLGTGRNGQHVLEELRFRRSITRRNIFIMVSAEASRNIVMSAYDCEPDDYLMKPLTAMMLQQRMTRLLVQREVLRPAYVALERGDIGSAMDCLIDLSIAENRYSIMAQKLLGELFIEHGELQKAEKLYTHALEIRSLDWARLGLAKVKQIRGDLETAGDWLSKIVEESPLFLPAYDVLADNWDKKGNKIETQKTVQRATEVSPMSILRQKRLAEVAEENGDILTSLEARRKTVRLGRLSCYGTLDDQFQYARVVSGAIDEGISVSSDIQDEIRTLMQQAQHNNDLRNAELARCHLLEGRIYASSGKVTEARMCMVKADELMANDRQIDAEVDRIELLFALGEDAQANAMLINLQQHFAGKQDALEKLDQFLDEPASEVNRQLVASVNREGIDFHSKAEYDKAIECFARARKLFPKHVGIHLNIVQSLVGKLNLDQDNNELIHESQTALEMVESLIEPDHKQYKRFLNLRSRIKEIIKDQI